MVTADKIDEMKEEMVDFGKRNFGIKNGADFSFIASSLLKAKAFKESCTIASMLGMLAPLMVKRQPDGKPSEKDIAALLEDSPVRDIIADVFYLGYRLGREDAEVASLEKLNAPEGRM